MVHHGFYVENELYWAGYAGGFERTSLVLWAVLAQSSRTIVDIGANTGLYALAARAINPTASVYAFEPASQVFDLLSANIRLNSFDIEALAVGVSDSTGTATFHELPGDQKYNASLVAHRLSHRPDDIVTSTVQVTRMDDFFSKEQSLGNILVKVDTELNEPQVLEGFGQLLQTHRPSLIVEVLNQDIGDRIHDVLKGHGYQCFAILEGEGIYRTEQIGLRGRNHFLCGEDVAASLGLATGRLMHRELHGRLKGRLLREQATNRRAAEDVAVN